MMHMLNALQTVDVSQLKKSESTTSPGQYNQIDYIMQLQNLAKNVNLAQQLNQYSGGRPNDLYTQSLPPQARVTISPPPSGIMSPHLFPPSYLQTYNPYPSKEQVLASKLLQIKKLQEEYMLLQQQVIPAELLPHALSLLQSNKPKDAGSDDQVDLNLLNNLLQAQQQKAQLNNFINQLKTPTAITQEDQEKQQLLNLVLNNQQPQATSWPLDYLQISSNVGSTQSQPYQEIIQKLYLDNLISKMLPNQQIRPSVQEVSNIPSTLPDNDRLLNILAQQQLLQRLQLVQQPQNSISQLLQQPAVALQQPTAVLQQPGVALQHPSTGLQTPSTNLQQILSMDTMNPTAPEPTQLQQKINQLTSVLQKIEHANELPPSNPSQHLQQLKQQILQQPGLLSASSLPSKSITMPDLQPTPIQSIQNQAANNQNTFPSLPSHQVPPTQQVPIQKPIPLQPQQLQQLVQQLQQNVAQPQPNIVAQTLQQPLLINPLIQPQSFKPQSLQERQSNVIQPQPQHLQTQPLSPKFSQNVQLPRQLSSGQQQSSDEILLLQQIQQLLSSSSSRPANKEAIDTAQLNNKFNQLQQQHILEKHLLEQKQQQQNNSLVLLVAAQTDPKVVVSIQQIVQQQKNQHQQEQLSLEQSQQQQLKNLLLNETQSQPSSPPKPFHPPS